MFQAISDLEYAGVLLGVEQAAYDEIYEWFRHNLKKPRALSRSSRPHAKNVAISWFKACANEHVQRMHQLASILRDHDTPVEILRTLRPGYIVYEDDHQVSAEPFRDSGA